MQVSQKTTVFFIGAKEAIFSYFTKGKPVSARLISKSSNIFLYKSSFCASNSLPAFCSLSVLVTNHATPTSYIIRRKGFRFWLLDEVREMCLLRLKHGHFSYKNAWICYRRPLLLSPPETCEPCFFMDSRTLIYVFWTVLHKHPLTTMIFTMFYITPIGFILKKKTICT